MDSRISSALIHIFRQQQSTLHASPPPTPILKERSVHVYFQKGPFMCTSKILKLSSQRQKERD